MYNGVERSEIFDRLSVELDRSGPVPLYYQIKQWLAGRVLSGELPPGTQLPDELAMSSRLGVSRGVVRQALAELCNQDLLVRQRGRGTFVSSPKTSEGLISGLRGLADDAALRGEKVVSKILVQREVPADEMVARSLKVPVGAPVIELERLRFLEEEPHVLVTTYLPALLLPGMAGRDLSGSVSLYKVLREDYKVPIISSRRRVEAAVADARQARLLDLKPGSPLLVLRSIGYTAGSRPIDVFIAFHRGDRSSFEVELSSARGSASRFQHGFEPDGVLIGSD